MFFKFSPNALFFKLKSTLITTALKLFIILYSINHFAGRRKAIENQHF